MVQKIGGVKLLSTVATRATQALLRFRSESFDRWPSRQLRVPGYRFLALPECDQFERVFFPDDNMRRRSRNPAQLLPSGALQRVDHRRSFRVREPARSARKNRSDPLPGILQAFLF